MGRGINICSNIINNRLNKYLDRIKDLSKIIVRGDMLFCEYIETKVTSLILLDSKEGKNGYFKVIAKGNKIEDVNVGDFVLDYDGEGTIHMYPKDGKQYCKLARHLCSIVVTPDNIIV